MRHISLREIVILALLVPLCYVWWLDRSYLAWDLEHRQEIVRSLERMVSIERERRAPAKLP